MRKIIVAGISYTKIMETYEEEKLIGLQKLFGKDESGTASHSEQKSRTKNLRLI